MVIHDKFETPYVPTVKILRILANNSDQYLEVVYSKEAVTLHMFILGLPNALSLSFDK